MYKNKQHSINSSNNSTSSNPQDLKIKKQLFWFTLVELIVVIVILTILATIAFLSFNSYSASSRNSSRATDISNIASSLELYNVKTWNYPVPDNSIAISYLGWSVWSQWTISDWVIRKLWNVGKKIVDPLTSSEYTYSALTYAKSSYQIKSDYEWDSVWYLDMDLNWNVVGIEKVNANSNDNKLTYIKGNYMNTVAKTLTWWLVYVVATPSIITTVTTSSEISNDSLSWTLLYNWQSSSSWIAYNPNRLVYTWITLPVDDSSWWLTKIMNWTISAYSWTIVASINSNVKELLNTPTTNVPTTGGYVVKNQLGGGSSWDEDIDNESSTNNAKWIWDGSWTAFTYIDWANSVYPRNCNDILINTWTSFTWANISTSVTYSWTSSTKFMNWAYIIDYDWVWVQTPTRVYCDMDNDWWWWTYLLNPNIFGTWTSLWLSFSSTANWTSCGTTPIWIWERSNGYYIWLIYRCGWNVVTTTMNWPNVLWASKIRMAVYAVWWYSSNRYIKLNWVDVYNSSLSSWWNIFAAEEWTCNVSACWWNTASWPTQIKPKIYDISWNVTVTAWWQWDWNRWWWGASYNNIAVK